MRMVWAGAKPSLRLASCCRVEVVNGGGGWRLAGLASTVAVLAFAALALLHGMLVVALAERWAPRTGETPSRRLTATRIAAGAAVLVALPGFIGALADILD